MDGAMTKSPLGGGKNRPQPHMKAKVRAATEAEGIPVGLAVDGANPMT